MQHVTTTKGAATSTRTTTCRTSATATARRARDRRPGRGARTNTRYLSDRLVAYCERLVATLPAPLEVCALVSSASEANELALRMARAYTGGATRSCSTRPITATPRR
jgi:4-aminobutyrate aminotransferase-like enzyme